MYGAPVVTRLVTAPYKLSYYYYYYYIIIIIGWLGGSVVERRSLTGELSLVCIGPAADG